jgi:hypothetical protein
LARIYSFLVVIADKFRAMRNAAIVASPESAGG